MFTIAKLFGKNDKTGGYMGNDLYQLKKQGKQNPMKAAFEPDNKVAQRSSSDLNHSNLMIQNDIVTKPGLLITN